SRSMPSPAHVLSLFPYTTLFRSRGQPEPGGRRRDPVLGVVLVGRRRLAAEAVDGTGTPVERARRVGRERYGFHERALFMRAGGRSEEQTSELQSLRHLVCRLLLD